MANTSITKDSQGNVISSVDNGGTINYTYKSIGRPGSVSNNGSTWTMVYDNYGRQTSLYDPNAGTISYQYNNFGEMTQQTDSKGTATFTYDVLGRISTEVRSEGTKNYTYDPTGNPGLLSGVTYPGGSFSLVYDSKSRLISELSNINGIPFTTSYTYDMYSRNSEITYPSTFGIKNIYNNFGYLDEVRRKDNNALIWNATSMNSYNQYTQYVSGNNLTTTKTFDCLGMLRSISTGSIQNLGYSFNEETGNLISRKDNLNNLTEIFSYDNLGRLTEVSGPVPLATSFANNGNISSKTSVGDYSYGTKPHAVIGVTNPDDLISSTEQRITYTSFNKADSIIEGSNVYTIAYGFDDQRTMSKLFNNGTLQKTVYYVGNYEKEEFPGGPSREICYIYGGDGLAAIYTKQYTSENMYYVHKDHLGSLDKVTNSSGAVVQSTSFDAWGRRRNPTNWTYSIIPSTIFSRGYTGHEHLDLFSLINMNGRIYDPILGRFFSPDNFVQAADFTQSYNRYSYALNNPFIYTDPDGENPLLIAAAIYFVFFTQPGYELQKYVSPVAFKVDLKFGTHQRGLGYDFSFGIPKISPYAKRWEIGDTYYWESYGNYIGWEHRKGSEYSILGVFTKSTIEYSADEFSQTVGTYSVGIPSLLGVDVSNDLFGDKKDRWRTSHIRANFLILRFGNTLFTGEPDPSSFDPLTNTYIPSLTKNPDSHRHGILYIGIGPMEIGWDSEGIRSTIQNTVHRWIGDKYFRDLRNTDQYEGDRFYFQFGWGGLW